MILEYDSAYNPEKSFYHSMIKSAPLDVMVPSNFQKYAERIWNLTPRPDDIWIVTYPKSGTTLTQEIMWQILNGIELESEASKKPIMLRCPFLEISMLFNLPEPPIDAILDEKTELLQDSVKWTNNLNSPRIIKSHLPIAMLPPSILNTSKVIYVGR